MSYKTEYGSSTYNEDDFAQVGTAMNELTVTITLCEYRNMVRELARQDCDIERLQQEADKYKKQCANMSDIILSKHKDKIAKIWELVLDMIHGGDASNDEESENDEDQEDKEREKNDS